ncbi:MAG: transporter substrate-binding domain-containing protein [Oscillospiraceae bacterium]|nr:transporter substrate-binding domain-containing protein [Oscillospiraceae bacterium]
MKNVCRLLCVFLSIIIFSAVFSGCNTAEDNSGKSTVYTSYKDIPGLSANDINELEELLSRKSSFTYAMLESTETFYDENGEIAGYTVLVCDWLSELFGVEFVPAILPWEELISGLETEQIDFSGTLTATEARLEQGYFMTSPIAMRWVEYFRIADSEPLTEIEIATPRLPRYALLANTASAQNVLNHALYEFEPVWVTEYVAAYELLKSGEVDAMLAESSAEAVFDAFGDIVTENYFPLIYSPVSLSTRNAELAPIINAVQRALENSGLSHLSDLYDEGRRQYTRNKLLMQFTPEEREFLRNNSVIPLGVEYDNYPVSFYSRRYNGWQGIAFDVLEEISWLTGLEFEIINDNTTEFFMLLEMLRSGEIHILSEVVQSPNREGQFLWPTNSFRTEQSVLISTIDLPNINVNRIYSTTVGLVKSNAHTEFFNNYFPDHPDTIVFDSQDDAREALTRGEIDMIMNSYSTLLSLTNYLELPNFKANIIFNNSFESTFGINKEQELLHSIIDKTLGVIDTNTISEQWLHKTYDYNIKLLLAQRPWMIGVTVLSLFVLVLVISLLAKSRHVGRRLEKLVALETTTLNTLFDSIPDLIFTKNSDLLYTHCNKAFLKHFGKSKDEILGKNDESGLGVSPQMAEWYNDKDRQTIREERMVTVEEYIPRADGEHLLFETSKIPLILDGKTIGIIGIAHDISKIKETENTIKENYDYANKLNDTLTRITKNPAISTGDIKTAAEIIVEEGCFALNTNRISIWSLSEDSNTLINISCYNSESGRHTVQPDFDLISREEYANLLKTKRLIVTNNIREASYDITSGGYGEDLCALLDAPIRVDGELVGAVCAEQNICAEYPMSREWLIKEQSFVSSLADLMALAISSHERHQAREEAEIANRSKSSFLANMSHEIRTPMNAILGITEILMQNETIPAEFEEGLGKIYNSCDMLLGIINDILDFSKIEAGKLDITPTQYKIASLINDSTHLNMMRIDSKPIEFELRIDENIPSKLIGDELRIKQVLNNLLSNAFKYTEKGKVTLEVTFETSAWDNYIMLVLNVIDTGRGMTEEQLNKMFFEYSRFTEDTMQSIEGTGLGLAITQRLVNLMDGKITAESELDAGSSFTVKLPQGIIDDELLGKEIAENLSQFRVNYMEQRKRSRIARNIMPYGRVLVVDDVETNLYVALGLLRPYKLQIETAMSGYEALDKVKDGNTYDIIFMDHMMPEMDGIETTTKLRELGYTAPIIALSANAVTGQSKVFLQNGFDDFISKPIDTRQLDSVLNNLIRDKQPPEVLEKLKNQANELPAASDLTPQEIDSMLLESFIRDARKVVDFLKELSNESSFENLKEDEEGLRKFTVFTHGIKSSLFNIGEKNLSELAFKLETDSRERNMEAVVASAPDFLNKLSILLGKMESEQKSNSASEGDLSISDIREKLLAIQELSADYNRRGALSALAEVKNGTKETIAFLEKIKEFIMHSDFEEAENAIAEELKI